MLIKSIKPFIFFFNVFRRFQIHVKKIFDFSVSFYLIASVSFPCRTYVGLMSWLLCLCRCCSLSGVPAFRCLIAFSFFRSCFVSEFFKLFVFKYYFFNAALRSYSFWFLIGCRLLLRHSVFTMSLFEFLLLLFFGPLFLPTSFGSIHTFLFPYSLLWGL